jgi:hypothetical protein
VAGGIDHKGVRLVRLATRALVVVVVVVLAASTVVATGTRRSTPMDEGRPVWLDPVQFTTRIDNPFWPMTPGNRWVYRETDGTGDQQRVEVTVTRQTKMILGIRARVVRDVVVEDGRVEVTDDRYAQDRQGNIWHLGERKHGDAGVKLGAGDPWEAGVANAQPTIVVRKLAELADAEEHHGRGDGDDQEPELQARSDDPTHHCRSRSRLVW